MADVCMCCTCSDKLKTRLEVFINALNALNNLQVTSARKLDMIFVLSNEINADNIMIQQIKNMQSVLNNKIVEVDSGSLPGSLKYCIEQSLNDIKVNNPDEYDTFTAVLETYWLDKYTDPKKEELAKQENKDEVEVA